MATYFHKISDVTLKWTQNLRTPDEFRGSKNYKVNMINLDVNKWKEFGVQTRPRQDRDGDMVFTLKRPDSKVINGKIQEFGKPDLVMKDGTAVDENTLIGNGTTADVEFVTYDTQMGKGHRVNKIIIKNLVEYSPPVEAQPDKSILD